MREIKFRAINKDNEFIYGLPYTDGTNETVYFKEYNNRLCWRREEDGASCNQPYKNGTLMQYTGLYDMNDKDVYEGDIVQCSQKGQTKEGVVVWNKGMWSWEYEKGKDGWLYEAMIKWSGKVIGNIYENPELLGG